MACSGSFSLTTLVLLLSWSFDLAKSSQICGSIRPIHLNQGRILFTHLGNDGMSFFDAIQFCYNNGLRPAVLKCPQDDQDIMKFLAGVTSQTINSRPFWLFLNDIEKEGVFKWIGKEEERPMNYTNWQIGSPAVIGQGADQLDCVSLQGRVDGSIGWINLPCSTFWRPLCQTIF